MAGTGKEKNPGQDGAGHQRQLGGFPSLFDPKLGHVVRLNAAKSLVSVPRFGTTKVKLQLAREALQYRIEGTK